MSILRSVPSDYDWNAVDYLGNTPLHLAVLESHVDCVRHFTTIATVDFNIRNFSYETALHLAAQKGDIEILTLLFNMNCDVNANDSYGNTPMFYADSSSFDLFLSNGSDINYRNNYGATPFLYYIQQGKVDIAERCLSVNSLKVDCCDSGLRNCLHLSSFRAFLPLCECIVSLKKVDVNFQTRRGNTSLHAAVEGRSLSVVKLLLLNGADPTIRNNQGSTPADLSKDDEIRSLLNDHTIFSRKLYIVGDRVARLVVSNETSNDGDLLFIVKSGSFPDINSINTVNRSLKDFIYLRHQLLAEFPEAALYVIILTNCRSDLSDLGVSSKPRHGRQLRKLAKRLSII